MAATWMELPLILLMWIKMVARECNLGHHLTDRQGAVIARQGVATDCLGATVTRRGATTDCWGVVVDHQDVVTDC
jgi:hypothetical protein